MNKLGKVKAYSEAFNSSNYHTDAGLVFKEA